MDELNLKPIFLTHHKCASGWLADILHDYYSVRSGQQGFATNSSSEFPDSYRDYEYLLIANADWSFLQTKVPKAAHIIRNPLAILVSSYFSHARTHPTTGWPELENQRLLLSNSSKEQGIDFTYEFISGKRQFHSAAIGPLSAIQSFDYDTDRLLTIRTEDFVQTPDAVMEKSFGFLGLEPPGGLLATFRDHTFEKKSGGRKPGQISSESHYRSGAPDDWVHHLTKRQAAQVIQDHPAIIERFYPEVLVDIERCATP